MTKNAFIFSWDMYGIESIVPITQYEHWDKDNLIRILKDENVQPNPLNGIVRSLVLRAHVNPQRSYEIYAVDCDETMDMLFWKRQWEDFPQQTAEILRERGHKIFSSRETRQPIIK